MTTPFISQPPEQTPTAKQLENSQTRSKPESRSRSKPPERLTTLRPVLRFTPTAWAKLHFFCHHGETEIGGFGVTSGDDRLLIEDFQTVRQTVSEVSVNFDDAAVADYFEGQVDDGLRPEQF